MGATRRRTRVQWQGAERTQKSPLLRLPAQLMLMILECYTLPDYPWLLTIMTTYKAFQLIVEPILYHNTTFDECKVANIFLRAVEKRPYRSQAVKSFGLDVKDGASMKAAFKPKLSNLVDLALVVDDASLFDLLLDVHFCLEAFAAGGQNYPSCFFDILGSQPRIDTLDLSFPISKKKPTDRPQISDPSALCYGPPLPTFVHPAPVPYHAAHAEELRPRRPCALVPALPRDARRAARAQALRPDPRPLRLALRLVDVDVRRRLPAAAAVP
ncbi:hypothetical protein BD413DRAFT_578459 [Trametes elegans]|nr:hypothetical protein BD413DRAFT_578459 [Trametes elegans]